MTWKKVQRKRRANEEQTNSPGERCTGAKRVFVSSRVARARQNINVIDIWTTLYKKKKPDVSIVGRVQVEAWMNR